MATEYPIPAAAPDAGSSRHPCPMRVKRRSARNRQIFLPSHGGGEGAFLWLFCCTGPGDTARTSVAIPGAVPT